MRSLIVTSFLAMTLLSYKLAAHIDTPENKQTVSAKGSTKPYSMSSTGSRKKLYETIEQLQEDLDDWMTG